MVQVPEVAMAVMQVHGHGSGASRWMMKLQLKRGSLVCFGQVDEGQLQTELSFETVIDLRLRNQASGPLEVVSRGGYSGPENRCGGSSVVSPISGLLLEDIGKIRG
jgi:hypothetical protein